MEKIAEKIVKALIGRRLSERGLASLKRQLAKKYDLPCPANSILLQTYHQLVKAGKSKNNPRLEQLLRTKPIRSLSGIINVSVLTKPYPCPGRCAFCPTETGFPKSYVSGEPAAERARSLRFSPYRQVQQRLTTLQNQGHAIDKIDLRIIGATWSFYPWKYRRWFIKECFAAANDFDKRISRKNLRSTVAMATVQRRNERVKQRIIGVSIETRPDYINEKEIRGLRELGVTKVELGVQSLNDQVLAKNLRGHGVKEVAQATKLLRDAGFKISYQMMLNLPGANPKTDSESFERLFADERFRPDFLKIYPCAILENTLIHRWFLTKRYQPYSLTTLVRLIERIKTRVPPYVRIERIIRDIPADRIVSGPTKVSNLRQLVQAALKKDGLACHCIRCREAKESVLPRAKFKLWRQDYQASAGQEIFLSFEDARRKHLYALLRLRLPKTEETGSPPFFPTLKGAALVREVHVYGQALPIGKRNKNSSQHQGLGRKLLAAAAKIALAQGFKKIAVIAGVGTRNYYRRLGYWLENTYMVKGLAAEKRESSQNRE
jgi:elongator complex protein 3